MTDDKKKTDAKKAPSLKKPSAPAKKAPATPDLSLKASTKATVSGADAQQKAYEGAAGKQDKVEKQKKTVKNPKPLKMAEGAKATEQAPKPSMDEQVEKLKGMMGPPGSGGGGTDQSDVEFMQPISAAHVRQPNRLASIMLYAVTAFFIIALLWANWAEIDEVTRGEGRVIPSGQIKMIDHLEGGIVQEILVTEGQEVKRGQVLLRIDSTVSQAGYEESVQHYNQARLQVERLTAQLKGTNFIVPEDIDKAFPDIANKERDRYDAAMQRVENEKRIAEQESEQKRQELKELEARLNQQEEQHKLDEEEMKLTEPLVKSGAASKIELLNLKRRLNEIRGEIAGTKAGITRAQAAIEQAEGRLKHVTITVRNEDLKELREAERRLAESRDAITTEKDRLSRTDVRSPVNGKVNELLVHTVGGVIQAGQDLISIVPIEDSLMIEAKVSPADIAFLMPGMPAIVKITAFDFSIYGGIDGSLSGISADAIKDEKDNTFFKIRVKTDRNYIEDRRTGEKLVISPGMVASVDILTGKKTVLEYVMKPIKKGINNAMTER